MIQCKKQDINAVVNEDDLDNIKNVRLVKSIVYKNKPDVKDIVLEEKEG